MSRTGDAFVHALSRVNIVLYRATRGRVLGRIGKAPVLLLTTTGRRSGAPRTTPLLYLADGDRLVVVASYGGRPHHPAWYLNLQAHPGVGVQIRGVHERRRARTATADEAEQLWPRLTAIYGAYADYRRRTTREIPVVVLEHDP